MQINGCEFADIKKKNTPPFRPTSSHVEQSF